MLHSFLRWSLRKPILNTYHVFFQYTEIFQWFTVIWKWCFHILIVKVSEKAIGYFERAALMQPDEVKWQLMIASCYRRSGNYHRALDTYKVRTRIQIFSQFIIVLFHPTSFYQGDTLFVILVRTSPISWKHWMFEVFGEDKQWPWTKRGYRICTWIKKSGKSQRSQRQ